jgi:anti-anti-sigma regulatory factor
MKNQLDPVTGMLQISVPGDLLSTNADQFRAGAFSLMDAQAGRSSEWSGVAVDLRAAQMVDSAGLNAIFSLIRRLKAEGKRASIQVKDPHVCQIFLFTRLDRLAEIVRS